MFISNSYSTYEEGYKYGYKIDFLQKDDTYLYFLNSGRPIKNISNIYIDGIKYVVPTFVLINSSWVISNSIKSGTIFRIPYNTSNITRIDFILDGKYVLHISGGEV